MHAFQSMYICIIREVIRLAPIESHGVALDACSYQAEVSACTYTYIYMQNYSRFRRATSS